MALFSYITVANTLVYYAYKLTSYTHIALLLPLLGIFFLKKEKPNLLNIIMKFGQIFFHFRLKKGNFQCTLLQLLFVLSQITLFSLLFSNQTDELMVSPWQTLNFVFFLIYAFSLFLYFLITKKVQIPLFVKFFFLISIFAVSYSVVPIIYTLGFGYDGFIHRVAENYIHSFGSISPKTPFYIGQYSVLVWFHALTGISLFFLDVVFVPFLASLLIPLVLFFTLKHAYKIDEERSLQISLFPLFLFFLSFHLTSPHNVVLLFLVLSVFILFNYIKNILPWYIPLTTVLIALCTHILLGAPLLLFFIAIVLGKNIQNTKIFYSLSVLYTFLLAFLFPVLFALYNSLSGYDFPTLINPFTKLQLFLQIFERPFWYKEHAGFILDSLYIWQYSLPVILFCISIAGYVLHKRKEKEYILFPLTAIGLFLGAWLLRSFIQFPNLAEEEQNNYPMRLVIASILFMLPWAIYCITQLKYNLKNYQKYIVMAMCSGILMTTLYFAYPQRNPKIFYPGFNITKYDFEAVRWIHAKEKENTETDYVVLANTLVSATAMTEYGFQKYYVINGQEQFYYSTPSGSPLYTEYLNMVYDRANTDHIPSVMNMTNTKTVYFVLNKYWRNYDKVAEEAKKTANEWHVIGKDDVFIFVYRQ
ncbi:MAG: hypothetical protein V1848_00040 [Candidatus Magasanikbacteria bacterium]